MPPVQCPRCGRFLKRSFVEALDEAPAACPRCGAELSADDVAAAGPDPAGDPAPPADVPPADVPAGSPPDATGGAPDDRASSVRPPDLAPEAVQDTANDVLHGWDAGTGAHDLARWHDDRRPFPVDTVVVGGAAVGGAVAGGLIARWRGDPVLAGVGLGLVGGAVAAGLGRRVWRLEA